MPPLKDTKHIFFLPEIRLICMKIYSFSQTRLVRTPIITNSVITHLNKTTSVITNSVIAEKSNKDGYLWAD